MNKTPKDNLSAFDALEALEIVRKKARALKELRDAEFDRFVETSDRPITFRDLMFALVVIDRIASNCVYRLEEIFEKVPKEERLFDEETFSELEHWTLREALFNLYFSHSGVKFPDKFFDEFDEPSAAARGEEHTASEAYHEARKREGLKRGEKPINPAQKE